MPNIVFGDPLKKESHMGFEQHGADPIFGSVSLTEVCRCLELTVDVCASVCDSWQRLMC